MPRVCFLNSNGFNFAGLAMSSKCPILESERQYSELSPRKCKVGAPKMRYNYKDILKISLKDFNINALTW